MCLVQTQVDWKQKGVEDLGYKGHGCLDGMLSPYPLMLLATWDYDYLTTRLHNKGT